MRQMILAAALLGALATSGGVLAHEGHHHDARSQLRIENLDLSKLPKSLAGEVAEVFERVLGPYLG